MKRNKSKVIKIREDEITDWSKLVGKQVSTYECSKPQLVCKNGPLEEKLLALSKSSNYCFRECGYFIAHCADGRYKQFCTSCSPCRIYPKDLSKALEGLRKKIGGKWNKVATFEFTHTHYKDICYDPLTKEDIEAADRLAELLYVRGVKNTIIMTAASERGYSFKYSPPLPTPNPEILALKRYFENKYGKAKEEAK